MEAKVSAWDSEADQLLIKSMLKSVTKMMRKVEIQWKFSGNLVETKSKHRLLILKVRY